MKKFTANKLLLLFFFLILNNNHANAFILERYDAVNFRINCDYFHWNNPSVVMRVDLVPPLNNFTVAETQAALSKATEDWNNVSSSNFRLSFSTDFSDYPSGDSPQDKVNSMHVYTSGWSLSSNALAVTWLTTTVEDCAYDTDIIINNQYFNYCASEIGKTCSTEYDVISVIRHEYGHVAGLDHPSTSSSLMFASLARNTVKHVSDDEVRGVTCLYPKQGLATDPNSVAECAYEENRTFSDSIDVGGRETFFEGSFPTGNKTNSFFGCASLQDINKNSQNGGENKKSFFLFLTLLVAIYSVFKFQFSQRKRILIYFKRVTFLIVFFSAYEVRAIENVKIHGGINFNKQNDFNSVLSNLTTKSSSLPVDTLKTSWNFGGSTILTELFENFKFGLGMDYLTQSKKFSDTKYSISAKAQCTNLNLIFEYLFFGGNYIGTSFGPNYGKGEYSSTILSSNTNSSLKFSGWQLGGNFFVGSDILINNFILNFEGGYRLLNVNYLSVDSSTNSTMKDRLGVATISGTKKTTQNFVLSFSGPYVQIGFGLNF